MTAPQHSDIDPVEEIISGVYEAGWQHAGGKPTEDFNPISQDEALAAINRLRLDDQIKLITELDNSVPNFWNTAQIEYTHQNMQDLLDLMGRKLVNLTDRKNNG